MTFKKILSVLCGCDGDRGAVRTAFALARAAEGHVQGLFVKSDPRDAVPLLGEGGSGALVDQVMKMAESEGSSRARTARELFDAARTAAGAAIVNAPPGPGGVSASWTEMVGRPEDIVVEAARLSDVSVFPHLGTAEETWCLLMLEAALMAGTRPLLLSPEGGAESLGRRVAVAWNGSAEAARAVAMGLPMLAAADEVTILTAETGKTSGSAGDELAAFLGWHGVRAAVKTVRVSGEPAGAALLSAAEQVGADLLLMGGYGHSRLTEMILGGVTRHVLNHAKLPVLMVH